MKGERSQGRQKEEVGRQHQGMDRPRIRQVAEGSGEQGEMQETGCHLWCPNDPRGSGTDDNDDDDDDDDDQTSHPSPPLSICFFFLSITQTETLDLCTKDCHALQVVKDAKKLPPHGSLHQPELTSEVVVSWACLRQMSCCHAARGNSD